MDLVLATQFTPIDAEARRKIDIRPGDSVRVTQKIKEGDKARLQAFEGLVIARKHGTEPGATFTVRKSSGGYGIERIFPLYSPMIEKIEIVRRGRARRAKLYYIREKAAREARRKMRQSIYRAPAGEEAAAHAEVREEAKAE